MPERLRRPAFTIVELLVVIGIITLLLGLLFPAVIGSRTQAKRTESRNNLRNLGIAHANYASEWNDRQFTLNVDHMSTYGEDAATAIIGYFQQNEEYPPSVVLGWAKRPGNDDTYLARLEIRPEFPSNYPLITPLAFEPVLPFGPSFEAFGNFRMPNARGFTEYLNGRFYDPVFYAPNDSAVWEMFRPTRELPGEYTPIDVLVQDYGWQIPVASTDPNNPTNYSRRDFCYSSYVPSPAAMFNPDVMRQPSAGGWQEPWSLPAGFRGPTLSQARFSDLKSHMIEHHWLQDPPSACNSAFGEDDYRPYLGCQPYMFNQGLESTPATLFYDGHVDAIGVRAAMQADSRMRGQAGSNDGLWSRDTPLGTNGYFSDKSLDSANTSFHILTSEGIRGRDVLADG